MKQIFLVIFGCFWLFSCDQNFLLSEKDLEDTVPFVDVTRGEINATKLDSTSFSDSSVGMYEHEGSDAFIEIKRNGKCTLFSPGIMAVGEYQNEAFEAGFTFSIESASEDILYMRPSSLHMIEYKIGSDYFKASEVQGFLSFIPFYGFGSSRLEVSPIMNDFIALPSGTYWRK